jgi:hypothetical protein
LIISEKNPLINWIKVLWILLLSLPNIKGLEHANKYGGGVLYEVPASLTCSVSSKKKKRKKEKKYWPFEDFESKVGVPVA